MVYFEKSVTEPASLSKEKEKKRGTYLRTDVLLALCNDFKNKCYICELKQPTSINVEHFKPHKGNKDLKFDWKNLFWSCYHCNITKSSKFINILNCTIYDDLVDRKIKYKIETLPLKVKIEAIETSPKVIETVKLLNAVYNGTAPLKLIECKNLRKAIKKEIDLFRTSLLNFYTSTSPEFTMYYEQEIKDHLDISSNFTAFKRWVIFDDPKAKNDFEKYCV